MRRAELIHLSVFAYFAVLAWLRPLSNRRRGLATGISAVVIGLVFCLPSIGRPGSLLLSIIRDWFPAPLMLVTYWVSGLFFIKPSARLQEALTRSDERFFAPVWRFRQDLPPAVASLLELAYLLCYAMVPFGLATLYLLRLGRLADLYWSVVLPPAYFCYIAFPILPTLPPRLAESRPLAPSRPIPIRRLNLWVLKHGSIGANTFPSAHVAASTAAALALVEFAPPVGMIFMTIASAIAVGSVYGRYHYAADALLGGGLAILSYFFWL